ncbi:type IX secretion system membrane protein PorP/SprF [Aquimarina sp. ERC-38]|uniref:PorP/SprF family type IX secretion system membrane protein n=1 Tax=Aquimarina sp. ERC-38 TaxID=2949996 RepID=UPI0022456199|nr:type IX secretion system membrane protein PorP/SprF [Aquimarina sp. ERC-38]UZO81187.1 type IX secretion system membrane protein PorP/SprF [Aquimarina sp. ERC-38]
MRYFILFLFSVSFVSAQDGFPLYTDYLSDNLYLVHPSMAGAANSNKIRLTARKQWFDIDNAPNTQSANINFRTGDKVGLGAAFYKDENGRFEQSGGYVTFAYHLLFSRDRTDLNMLSFGLSALFAQSNVDLRGLFDPTDQDPIILPNRVQKDGYFNLDFGLSYNFLNWYAHFTVKNLIPFNRDIFDNTAINFDPADPNRITTADSNNQRRYLFSGGKTIGISNSFSIEPSFLYQITENTGENTIDINAKVYQDVGSLLTLWGGISYRRAFDGAQFSTGGLAVETQKLQYITPFAGFHYKQWMLGYTYNYQLNDILVSNSGFHQLTLGYDFGKRKERYPCLCPAINL